MLESRYKEMDTEFTPARRRMARIPDGATLIANPVSGAPGFQTGNVFTLAGVPKIVEGMLGDISHRLETGAIVHSLTVRGAGLREGDVAESLAALAERYADLSIGSYPWFQTVNNHGVALVVRGTDQARLDLVREDLEALMLGQGVEPELIQGEV